MSEIENPRQKDDLEDLYLEFLQAFYEDEDHPRSLRLAGRLEVEMARRPDLSGSIRGDEIRSLISELNGDLESAVKDRQREIRKIFELHSLSWNSPSWEYVLRQYDYRDISDRMDILAALYARMGDYKEAASLLHESRDFCMSHKIPFDAEDLLEDVLGRSRDGPAA